MKVLDIGKNADRPGDRFPLRAGRQRIAAAHARERRSVPRTLVQLVLDGRRVGSASKFSIDDSGAVHAEIRLEGDLKLDRFYCEPIWRRGCIVKIHVHPHVRLVEDGSELELVDDESGARMDND